MLSACRVASCPAVWGGLRARVACTSVRPFSDTTDRPKAAESFISLAREHGASHLENKPFPASHRFDSALAGMVVGAVRDGIAECTMTVSSSVQNSYATLHGGAISTLVDVMGTLALISVDHTRAGVSVDLSVSFCSAAKSGDEIVAVGRVLKAGRALGFTEVHIRDKSSGRLIASGRHTKAL